MCKKNKGGAYILVAVSTLMILTLVLTALTVTAVSRRTTARYGYFYGMYDLAVFGNEQGLILLNQKNQPFTYDWQFCINIGEDIRDEFFVNTVVVENIDGFYITTTVHRYVDNFLHNAVARSRVKILDDYTLAVVELVRIAD